MSFRRRSSRKPSSSRGYNKFRFTNKHDVAEIESWVDYVSKMTVIMKNNLVFKFEKEGRIKIICLWCMRKNEEKACKIIA